MNIIKRDDIAKVLGGIGVHEKDLAKLFKDGLTPREYARPYTTEFPLVNAWEDASSFNIESELPGFQVGDISVEVTGGKQLTIKGERRPPATEGHWHRKERGFGQFARHMTLPFEVEADNVNAQMRNGVLCIRLLRKSGSQSRKIEIKVV